MAKSILIFQENISKSCANKNLWLKYIERGEIYLLSRIVAIVSFISANKGEIKPGFMFERKETKAKI